MTKHTQSDRELVAGIIEAWGLMSGLTVEHIRRGLYDGDRILQLATDHRVNALTGIANPSAVADVVEALRDARTTIVITRTNIMTEISRYSDASESRWAGVPEQLQKRIDNIDAALAKLGDGL